MTDPLPVVKTMKLGDNQSKVEMQARVGSFHSANFVPRDASVSQRWLSVII